MNRTNEGVRRAAAYCRVSTEVELQEGSFELQQEYYRQRILNDSNMALVDVYGDKGKSGRSVHSRPGFQRMMCDCEAGRIDVILTKSLSRFARNMADCLSAVRRLRELGIPVVFEREGINTMDGGGELLLSILASIAQEESSSIGENLRWSMERSNARGEPFFRAAYGYRKEPGSRAWRIEPEEARRVRLAFDLAVKGVCYRKILERINEMERAEGTGAAWSRKRLNYMLSNVAYMGDCLTNRNYTVYTDRRIHLPNRGERDQYYLEDHHEPIVSREQFERVQIVRKSGLLHSYAGRRERLTLLAAGR